MKNRHIARPCALAKAGTVAATVGIGVQTLHYYERIGLLTKPQRSSANYRLYSGSLCCVGPLVLIALGIGTGAAVIGRYHWFFIIVALAVLAWSWTKYLRAKLSVIVSIGRWTSVAEVSSAC